MNQDVANRLFEYRKKSGFSQEELGEKIGVSRQAISKWERGESSPDTDNLIALSKIYNITIDELINGKAENEAPQGINTENGDKVDIGLKGINVESANGDKVHVGIDGIRVVEGSKSIEENRHIFEKEDAHPARNSLIFCLGLIAFLLTGFFLDWWAFGWTFILLGIGLITLIEAIERKKPEHFAYALPIVAAFCIVGITTGIWHPTWALFLTIPIYYIICDAFKKKK